MTVKVSLGATVPVVQYGNLSPTVEVEGETVEQALEAALGHVKAFWDRVSPKPLEIDRQAPEPPKSPLSPNVEEKKCWASGSIVYFDPIAHTYQDAEGNYYLGGSTFAHRFVPDFPAESISQKMADKSGVSADEIRAMWKLNSEASTSLGTGLHAALELRQKYGELSRAIKNGSVEAATTGNPILRPIVEAFFTEWRAAQNALAEVFVADPKRRHAGLIDRMVIEPDGVELEDYKSSKDVLKKESIAEPFKGLVPNNQLGVFTLKLNFYRRILTAHGVNVKALRVHHWTGKLWDSHELEILDLDDIMTKANQS